MKRIFCIIFGAMLLLCACSSDKEEESSIKNSHELKAETGDKSENGKVIVFEAEDITPSKSDLKNAAEILRVRLDDMGYTEAKVSAEDDCITVEIAEKTNLEELAESLGATAQLKFYDNNGIDQTTGMPIEGAEVLSDEHIRGASAKLGSTSETGNEGYYVELRLTKDGQKAFYEATQRNVGESIYIMLDGEVICAPMVSQAINDDTCVISGDFTQEEAKKLAANIKSGQLPFKLTVREVLPLAEFYDE